MSLDPTRRLRVREIFEAALALPVVEQREYVAAACGGDATLREQVERMLESSGRAASFLETPATSMLEATVAVPSLEGQRVGPYQLSSRIGAGGMGEVFKAVDTRLDRTVAVKVLRSHVANDPQARERFDREARAVAALNHPNICALYDVGESTIESQEQPPASVRFLVMEFLEGETLGARLARGPLPLPEALEYAGQIVSALDSAHRAGIVHRDLKPGNIFLVGRVAPPRSDDGRHDRGLSTPGDVHAKLLDFGLAKAGRLAAPGGTTAVRTALDLTMPGTILGTVQYMAPEQIEGKDTDARTDIFAFGAVLFEMVTGRKAFEADSQASIMVAILDREPWRLTALQPLAPPWLEHIVWRCLAKHPEQRWQSARDVVIELQSMRDATPSLAAAGSLAPSRGAPPWRTPTAGAAALVVALTIGWLTLGRGWLRGTAPVMAPAGDQKAALAVLPLRSIDLTEADALHIGVGIADAIVTRLAGVQSIRVRPTSATASFEGRPIDVIAISRQLQVDHVLTGTVRRAEDAYRFNLQLIRASDGIVVWGRQIDVSRRGLFGVEDQVTAEVVAALQLQISGVERSRLNQRFTQNPDAYDEYLQGRTLLANYSESNLRQAMSHFERALQIDRNFVLADAGLAMAAGTFSVRFAYDQQAMEWGRRAEEYANRTLKRDANLGEAHLALASAAGTLYRNFDWPTVIREAQVALSLNPNLDLAHAALARAFYHIGLLDWSDVESRRAEDASGGTNVEVGRVRLYNQLLSGHFDEARRGAEALLTRTDAQAIRQYLGLAVFYSGDRTKGQELLAGVRRPDGRTDTRSQASLAGVLAANGQREEAERTIRGVLASGYMDHHVAYGLGAASAQLGRRAEALKWLRTAAETGFPCFPWIDRDPLLDPIRSDQAYQAFVVALRTEYDRARARYQAVTRVP